MPSCYILQEGLSAGKSRVTRFIKRYKDTGFIDKCSENSQPTKITDEVTLIVDRQMEHDEEMTVKELHVHVHVTLASDEEMTVKELHVHVTLINEGIPSPRAWSYAAE